MSSPDSDGGPAPPPLTVEPMSEEQAVRFERRLQTLALALLIVVLLVHLLREFAPILQPLFIALFVAYLVLPADRWLVRRGVPRWLAILILANAALLVLFGTTELVLASVRDFRTRLPVYQDRVGRMAELLADLLPAPLATRARETLADTSRLAGTGLAMTQSALGGVIDSLTTLFVIAVDFGFLVAEYAGFEARVRRALSPERADHALAVLQAINTSISQYIVVKTFSSVLTGVLTTVILVLFGVDFPVMWGVLAFFANYIPYVGSLVAVLLPAALDVVQYESLGHSLVLLL